MGWTTTQREETSRPCMHEYVPETSRASRRWRGPSFLSIETRAPRQQGRESPNSIPRRIVVEGQGSRRGRRRGWTETGHSLCASEVRGHNRNSCTPSVGQSEWLTRPLKLQRGILMVDATLWVGHVVHADHADLPFLPDSPREGSCALGAHTSFIFGRCLDRPRRPAFLAGALGSDPVTAPRGIGVGDGKGSKGGRGGRRSSGMVLPRHW